MQGYQLSFRDSNYYQRFQGIKLAPSLSHYPDKMVHVTCEILPTYPIVVNRTALALANMSWGVVPTYIDDPKQREIQRRNMVNARSERIIDDKKSYWYRLRKNRCLIPATGIYEHQKVKGFKNKIPYHISIANREGFYVPALYQVSQEVDQSTGEVFNFASFTMITRGANEKMAWIHNDGENKHRMPLFVTPEIEHAWVLDDLSDNDMTEIFNYTIPSKISYITRYFLFVAGKSSPKEKSGTPIMIGVANCRFMARRNPGRNRQACFSIIRYLGWQFCLTLHLVDVGEEFIRVV